MHVPVDSYIADRRVSCVFNLVQAAALALGALYALARSRAAVPVHVGSNMWMNQYLERDVDDHIARGFPSYCDNPMYNFRYDAYWDYSNITCRALPLSQMFVKSLTKGTVGITQGPCIFVCRSLSADRSSVFSLSLSVSLRLSPSLSVSLRLSPSLSVSLRLSPSLSVSLRLSPSLSVSLRLSPSLSVSLCLSPSLPVSLPPPLCNTLLSRTPRRSVFYHDHGAAPARHRVPGSRPAGCHR
jgi:hypothetical protein